MTTWTYTQDADGDHAIWEGKYLIAVTDGWGGYVSEVKRSREEDEANARLIAAAPELLDACRKAVDDSAGDISLEALNALDAAIAKAEG